MLKYIHQFVQTFLREASKSRPKSRESSRSSVNLMKKESTRPEILAIGFNNEGQEAKYSKEILELKRTYSLIMKKFVNPKLDLMTNTNTASDIFSLKGKEELVRSALNKIFQEIAGQQKQIEGSPTNISAANLKSVNEEKSVGWSGQQTSKLAANPMVETSSQPNNIASIFYSFPEIKEQSSDKNTRQTDKFIKQRFKITRSREQSIDKKQNVKTASGNVVGSNLGASGSFSESKPKHILVSRTTNTNLDTETVRETKKENICSENIDKCFPPEDTDKEQTLLSLEQNDHPEISERLNQFKEDLTQHNKKENLNIIRSIGTVNKNKIDKSNSHPLNEKNNDKMKVVKSINSDQNEILQVGVNKQQKVKKNVKIPVDMPKLGFGMLKKKEPTTNKKYSGKNEQSTSFPLNPKVLISDSLPNDCQLPPTIVKAAKLANKSGNKTSEKDEPSVLKINVYEDKNKATAEASGLKNLLKPNVETTGKEQNQAYCNETKLAECDSKEPSSVNISHEKNVDQLTNEVVNEKSKSDNSYWTILSNKLIKTKNDAQKFISDFEMSNFKTLDVNKTDTVTKDCIGSNMPDKENLSKNNNKPEQNNENIPNNSDFKTNSGFKLHQKEIDNVNSKTAKFHDPEFKAPIKSGQLQSIDSNSARTTLNSTNSIAFNFEQNNISTKSCKDFSKNITNMQRTNERQTDLNSSSINVNNIVGNEVKDIKNGIKSNSRNIIHEGDSKIKKLVKHFKKLQNNKSKQSIQRVSSKILSGGQPDKASLRKIKTNKNLSHKIRKAVRSKSGHSVIKKPLSSDNALKREILSNSCTTAGPNTDTLGSKKNRITMKKQKLSVSSTSLSNPTKGVKVNNVDSNIFSNVNRKISKHEFKKEIEQTYTSKLSALASNPTKARKLHSRREFIKPKTLQMYGAKRSIYTYSNPEATLSLNTLELNISKNITEPNMASSSLINVCVLTPNKQTSSHPLSIQVRNIHTNVLRSKVKQLTRKKRNTVIRGNGKSKSNTDPTVCCPTGEVTANTSTPREIELKNNSHLTTTKSLHKISLDLSPKDELPKAISHTDVNLNRESQSKMLSSTDSTLLKGTHNSSLLPNSSKLYDNPELVYRKSERNGSLQAITNSKEDNLIDFNRTVTIQQQNGTDGKSTELVLNLDSQNIQPSQGNETIKDSPKWRSKADRLEKWKLEIESSNIKDKDEKTKESSDNYSNSTQTETIKTGENTVTFVEDGDKKILAVHEVAKSNNTKVFNFSNENMEKFHFHKNDKSGTMCDLVEKIVKTEYENKRLTKDPTKHLITITNKDLLNQIKNENINVMTAKNKAKNEEDEPKKKDSSTNKIKEFESKLRVLESKLKVLESKSVGENNADPLSKNNSQNNKECVSLYPKGNCKIVDKNKTRSKSEKKDSECVKAEDKNKLASLAQSMTHESKITKKNKNDPMKEHLSQKVKNLELKLKTLETKVKDLKEKPADSTNVKVLPKMFSLSKSSEDSIKPKSTLNKSKLEERGSHHHDASNKQGNFKNTNKNYIEGQNKEGYSTKLDVYLNQHLSANKNSFKEKMESAKCNNIVNSIVYPKIKNVSPSPQVISSKEEHKLKNTNVKTVRKLSEKTMKKKLQPKFMKSSVITEVKKDILNDKSVADMQQPKKMCEKTNVVPVTTKLHAMMTRPRKIKKEDNIENKYANQNISRQNSFTWDSTISNNNQATLKTYKGRNLSDPSSLITTPENNPIKTAFKSNISTLKCNSSNNERKDVMSSTKNSPKKTPSPNIEKKTLLKRNSNQLSKKGYSMPSYSGAHIKEKQNTHHEDLLNSTRRLKTDDTKQAKVIDKRSSSSQAKLPSREKSLKSSELPQKIFKVLNNLKNTSKIIDNNNLKRNMDSTVLTKSENVESQIDSTNEKSYKSEIRENKFNSFDYYRPKRRTYEVKHPIEKEKCGIEFYTKNEDILDKFHQVSQNSTLRSLELNRSIKDQTKFYRENNKQLNILISHKNPTTEKLIRK